MTVSADDLARELTASAGGPDALRLDLAEALNARGAAKVIANSVLAALSSVAGSATARTPTAPPKRGRPPKARGPRRYAEPFWQTLNQPQAPVAAEMTPLAALVSGHSSRGPPLAYSIEDLAKSGLLSRYQVHALTKTGALKCRKVGRRTIILHEDLLDYLRRCPVGPDRSITEKADVARGIREPPTARPEEAPR